MNSIIDSIRVKVSAIDVHEPTTRWLIVSVGIVLVYNVINWLIMRVYNFERDMTQAKYCAELAQVDNRIKRHKPQARQRAHIRVSADNVYKQQATGDDNNNDSNNSNNNNNCETQERESEFEHGQDEDDFAYPQGWIPIIESADVAPGQVKGVCIMGRDLIVSRSLSGSTGVSVFDAYCPHMGVNIGVGGVMRDIEGQSCIECPFHGWRFNASDGRCVQIPYQTSCGGRGIPDVAKLKKWHSVEVDNFVHIWYHPASEYPTWELEPIPEIANKTWHLAGRSAHVSNLDMRDVLENGADMNHFEAIHNDIFLFGSYLPSLRALASWQAILKHGWQPRWEANQEPGQRHKATMTLTSWITVFKHLKTMYLDVCAHQVGPGKVNLCYTSDRYGCGVLIMSAIPIGGRRVRYVQHIYTSPTWFSFIMAKVFLIGEINMIERDFIIWNHKLTTSNPVFIAEDATLKRFRRWYAQFYQHKRKKSVSAS